jgi:hypothetical protein
MTKKQMKSLVRDIFTGMKQEIIAAIDGNQIPDNWNGTELRQLIADKAAEHAHVQMSDARRRAYNNDVVNFNI